MPAISLIWAFLKGPLGGPALIGIGALVMAGALSVEHVRLVHAKGALAVARAELYVPDAQGKPTRVKWQDRALMAESNLGTCKLNTADLQKGIEAQNLATDALKADEAQRERLLAQAAQAAQRQAKAALSAADRISAINPPAGDVCTRLLAAEKAVSEASQ